MGSDPISFAERRVFHAPEKKIYTDPMIAHTSLTVSNYKKSKDFYTRILKALGYTQNMEYGEAAGYTTVKIPTFGSQRVQK